MALNSYERHERKKALILLGILTSLSTLVGVAFWNAMQPKDYDKYLVPESQKQYVELDPRTEQELSTLLQSQKSNDVRNLENSVTNSALAETNAVQAQSQSYTNASTKVPKIKNNNPGNIRAVKGIKWKGQIDSKYGFCVFDTLENGLRAMNKNLRTYNQKYGRDTIQEIVESWAPYSENNTQAYILAVSKQTGYAPNQELDISDKSIATNIITAMVKQEHGKTLPKDFVSKALYSSYN